MIVVINECPYTRCHAAAVVEGKIYTIGGDTGPGTADLSIVEEYDPGLPDSITNTKPAGRLLKT